MLLPRRVAGRTLGLHGPDLARGPEVARLWSKAYCLAAHSIELLTKLPLTNIIHRGPILYTTTIIPTYFINVFRI